jgi:hypothetical protein
MNSQTLNFNSNNHSDSNNSVIMLNTANAKKLGLSEEEIADLTLDCELLMTIKTVVSKICQRFLFIN